MNRLTNGHNSSRSYHHDLMVTDLDFSDLTAEDETDIFFLPSLVCIGSGMIPPPPPPPPTRMMAETTPDRVPFSQLPALRFRDFSCRTVSPTPSTTSKNSLESKEKKTLKLFWKEVKEDKSLLDRLPRKKTIWDEIKPVSIDVHKLEDLFENRSKEVKKAQEGKKSEILVLDAKRSNAINIGMTKLPPPRVVKTAIVKMDSSVIGREGIEKVLTMIPTDEEKNLILEAQQQSPDLPLGSAETFLMTLASISALEQRLRLWLFRFEFDSIEKELGEQLMDLKIAMTEIEKSETFKIVLATLLAMGNFLNGVECKGFQLEYLAKVPEVKDTVHKHSLLFHVASFVIEKYPQSSDLYSDLGAVCRASRVDFTEVSKSLARIEKECMVSWERLTVISSNDPGSNINIRMTDFLHDCTKRIDVLKIVQRRIFNRFRKSLLYLGFSSSTAKDMKPESLLKIVSEFALEYRTMREKAREELIRSQNEERKRELMRQRQMKMTHSMSLTANHSDSYDPHINAINQAKNHTWNPRENNNNNNTLHLQKQQRLIENDRKSRIQDMELTQLLSEWDALTTEASPKSPIDSLYGCSLTNSPVINTSNGFNGFHNHSKKANNGNNHHSTANSVTNTPFGRSICSVNSSNTRKVRPRLRKQVSDSTANYAGYHSRSKSRTRDSSLNSRRELQPKSL